MPHNEQPRGIEITAPITSREMHKIDTKNYKSKKLKAMKTCLYGMLISRREEFLEFWLTGYHPIIFRMCFLQMKIHI